MDKEKIGRFIGALRKEQGMTQRELAERLHVSDRTVSKWERGAGLPDASLMIGLADSLGISVNELLAGERKADAPYTEETKQDIKEAAAVIYQHLRREEKERRWRLLAVVAVLVLVLGAVHFALRKAGEDRILFPPEVNCELLQKDADIEAVLTVERSATGVYDYGCAYEMDRYGNVQLRERSVWESYTGTVSKEVYEELRELCPGEIRRIDPTEAGYLVASYLAVPTVVLTETDAELNVLFRYELDLSFATAGLSASFLSGETLYMLCYNSDEECYHLVSVNKTTGEETRNSFTYRDFVPDADEEESMGGFLFSGENMWVKDDVFYFAETYHKSPPVSIFAAYDLKGDRAIHFETVENSHVMLVEQDLAAGEVSVLVNPMDYRPLELYTLDAATLERKGTVQMELPSEYLTRKNSEFSTQVYYLFSGDMDEEHIAVLFGDTVSRAALEDDVSSRIMVVYDRSSGESLWRGRFTMEAGYAISEVELLREA